MIYAWVIALPAIILGKKGIFAGLVSLSVFTIPYLFALSRFTRVNGIFSIGTAEPFFDVWDILTVFVLLVLAFVCFICDYARKRIL